MEKIDFVIAWVDGNDPKWQEEKAKYQGKQLSTINRYRDWDNLVYLFRGIEQYAPWVNKVYLVTCGQIPTWLNLDNPKLVLINHEDYIDKTYLPTFSSHPIELNFHKIKDLSEQFVYFNDDMFLTKKTKPTDFFKKGLPRDEYVENNIIADGNNDSFPYILLNNMDVINHHFNKRQCFKKHFFHYFNIKYGINNLRTFFLQPWYRYSGFQNPHVPSSFLKSTLETVWKVEENRLNEVCKHRFRSKEDVNQYLFRYWQLCEGNFVPRRTSFSKVFHVEANNTKLLKAIRNQTYHLICINDNDININFEQAKKEINEEFRRILPNQSSFEK